jgi:GDP-L-fucose synthase
MVGAVVGYQGRIVYDASKPDGTPRRVMDVSRLRALGWSPRISLADGIAQTYRWFVENASSYRGSDAHA